VIASEALRRVGAGQRSEEAPGALTAGSTLTHGDTRIDVSSRVRDHGPMRTKRTYNLPERTLLAVRELAATYGVASTQDGVIELAVDELARRLRDDAEADRWTEAAADPAFRAETVDLATAYEAADRETWPRE